ncbi:MAG: GNAT family N-acetyltransferase [Steroidobacteraceae bacterium]
MGNAAVAEGRQRLRAAGVPLFSTPENAVEVMRISAWYRNQQMLLQVPGPLSDEPPPDLEAARAVLGAARAAGRTLLTPRESKALLAAFRIPVAESRAAADAETAVAAADALGYPVALTIDSPDIAHKSDVGGVQLGLASGDAVRAACAALLARVRRERPAARILGVTVERMHGAPGARELMVGVARDRVFGAVIVAGAGGIAVEVLADRAVELPPLNRDLAAAMLARTRIDRALGAFRGYPPVDRRALERVLLRVSEMACELPAVLELDINPLSVDEHGACALDARVVLATDTQPTAAARYAHVAIHPYPAELASLWQAPDGRRIEIRPIRPEDAALEQRFVQELSPRSRYLRFMQAIRELTPAMLARFTQLDYGRDLALVALEGQGAATRQVGVARYAATPDGQSCEFGIAVADDWARHGLGRHLLERLVACARERGFASLHGEVLPENISMLALARALGFTVERSPDDPTVERVTLALRPPTARGLRFHDELAHLRDRLRAAHGPRSARQPRPGAAARAHAHDPRGGDDRGSGGPHPVRRRCPARDDGHRAGAARRRLPVRPRASRRSRATAGVVPRSSAPIRRVPTTRASRATAMRISTAAGDASTRYFTRLRRSGRPALIVAHSRDVTQEALALERTAESQLRLESVVHEGDVGVVEIDVVNDTASWSGDWCERHGIRVGAGPGFIGAAR